VRIAYGQRAAGARGKLRTLDIGKEVSVRGHVPYLSRGVIVNGQEAKQRKACLKLKNQKISGLKILRHTHEISIDVRLLIES
jgi:hypothetical protein